MTLTSKPLAVVIVIMMFGGIFFSDLMGWWQTKNSGQGGRYGQSGNNSQVTPEEIRGNYTFGDVQATFGIPVETLAQAFGVPLDDAATFRLNGLENLYAQSEFEVGTESVKLFVAFYRGQALDLSEDIYLPESAAAILMTRSLSAEQLAYLPEHTVADLEGVPTFEGIAPETSEGNGAGAVTGAIRGRTTFRELQQWGLTQAQIETVLGVPMPSNPDILVRDYCTEQGLSYGTVKAGLQAELDG